MCFENISTTTEFYLFFYFKLASWSINWLHKVRKISIFFFFFNSNSSVIKEIYWLTLARAVINDATTNNLFSYSFVMNWLELKFDRCPNSRLTLQLSSSSSSGSNNPPHVHVLTILTSTSAVANFQVESRLRQMIMPEPGNQTFSNTTSSEHWVCRHLFT